MRNHTFNTLQHWKQRPIQLYPTPKFLFNVAKLSNPQNALHFPQDPSTASFHTHPDHDRWQPFSKKTSVGCGGCTTFLWGKQRLCQRHKSCHAFHVRIGLLPLTYKFQKKGVSLNPLHSHCQLANLVTIVTLRPEPGLLWPCERPPQGSWEHAASSKWWNLGHAPLLVKHMIICNISYQYSVYKVSEIS